MRAEVLLPLGCALGEGASAVNASEFWFVDIRAGQVHRGSVDGSTAVHAQFDHTVSAVVPTMTGEVVVAGRQDVSILGEPNAVLTIPETDRDIRLNDGKADPIGRFVVGSMAEPVRSSAGSLWSISNGECSKIVDDVTISNGLCWSADGSTMFYIDTPTGHIDAFDYDLATGKVSERRTVVTIEATQGSPDGMTIDADGGLWVALWDGSAVCRYLDGRLDQVVDVPTPFVTSCTFVGTKLVVTTAREPNPDDPFSGHVFVADIGMEAPLPHSIDRDLVFGSAKP